MEPKISPLEALQYAISAAVLSSRPHKPGVIIQNLPQHIKDALKNLTSKDSRNIRI